MSAHIYHDLSPAELAFLIERASKLQHSGRRMKWVWSDNPHRSRIVYPSLTIVGGEIVGARSGDGKPPGEIVRAMHDTFRRRQERASAAAKKAAVTRAARVEQLVYEAARDLIENRLSPRDTCRCCGREVSDAESIRRGIGSECWQRVLAAFEVVKRAAAVESTPETFTGSPASVASLVSPMTKSGAQKDDDAP